VRQRLDKPEQVLAVTALSVQVLLRQTIILPADLELAALVVELLVSAAFRQLGRSQVILGF
jgi:hypothetical protein